MVIRVLAVPDSLLLHEFDAVFRTVLGWDNIGFLFRVHGQEFNSFRRATRSRTLREFQLRSTETFLYTWPGARRRVRRSSTTSWRTCSGAGSTGFAPKAQTTGSEQKAA